MDELSCFITLDSFETKTWYWYNLNVIIIALVLDYTLPYLPNPEGYGFKLLQIIIGVLITGLGSGFYLISNLGPGPRDG